MGADSPLPVALEASRTHPAAAPTGTTAVQNTEPAPSEPTLGGTLSTTSPWSAAQHRRPTCRQHLRTHMRCAGASVWGRAALPHVGLGRAPEALLRGVVKALLGRF